MCYRHYTGQSRKSLFIIVGWPLSLVKDEEGLCVMKFHKRIDHHIPQCVYMSCRCRVTGCEDSSLRETWLLWKLLIPS